MPIQPTFHLDLSNSVLLEIHQSFTGVQRGVVESLAEVLLDGLTVRPSDRQKMVNALSVLCANLIKVHDMDANALLAVPRSNGYYTATRYNSSGFGYRIVIRLIKLLEEREYIQYQNGFCDRDTGVGKVSRVKALPSLITRFLPTPTSHIPLTSIVRAPDAEVIRLKDGNKNLIKYVDTYESEQMRRHLREWNEFAFTFRADLYLTDEQLKQVMLSQNEDEDEELEAYNPTGREDKPRHVDLTKRPLYRIFNNGVWTNGGRFYGGWHQHVPKAYRKYITINGLPTVELDFGSMLVSMLYAKQGLQFEGDAYEIVGLGTRYRKLIKTEIFRLINARPGQQTRRPKRRDMPVGWTYERFKQVIEEKHAPIADYFLSGIGIEMQKLDSQIAEGVMGAMRGCGALVLPIHDSFIVAREWQECLSSIMITAYEYHMSRKTIEVNVCAHSLQQITISTEPRGYEGYHRRHADFFGVGEWDRVRQGIAEIRAAA